VTVNPQPSANNYREMTAEDYAALPSQQPIVLSKNIPQRVTVQPGDSLTFMVTVTNRTTEADVYHHDEILAGMDRFQRYPALTLGRT
jgi:hypothetical protein